MLKILDGYALDDTFFVKKLQEIIKKYQISTVVETGINQGKSTLKLTEIASKVVGVDISQECVDTTKLLLKKHRRSNYLLIHGDSPEVLKGLVQFLDCEHTIFFLDAHWHENWPLNDEINSLERNKGIIILHDILVPNHPELGYDDYPITDPLTNQTTNQPLSYEFVKNSLTKWSLSHKIEYNDQADNSKRGIAYIFPK